VLTGSLVSDPTSAAFGRGSDRHELFVTTNVLGAQIVGGVTKVDVTNC
jgi:hypothetical protein